MPDELASVLYSDQLMTPVIQSLEPTLIKCVVCELTAFDIFQYCPIVEKQFMCFSGASPGGLGAQAPPPKFF